MNTAEKTVLTTGEVARLCNVAPRTVSKWFDSGQLRGYRIPGSKDRRIPVDQLIRFMRAHGIPLNGLDAGQTRVLLIESDSVMAQAVAASLSKEGFEVQTASTALEAGAAAVELRPHVVVVDTSATNLLPAEVVRFFRSTPDLSAPRLVALTGGSCDSQGVSLLQIGFEAFLRKPFDVRSLIRLIETTTVSRIQPQLI
jgi:excisionase family DNA binding protein